MTAVIISDDDKGVPVIAHRRQDGVSIAAGKNLVILSYSELRKLVQFANAVSEG
jgi:hypothetical protein